MKERLVTWARVLWTCGAAAFLVHAVAAFHTVYSWSHEIAWQSTAEQTAELTGWRSGSGLYLNYLFGLLWLIEVCWWWAQPISYARRPRLVADGLELFFLFMILNGAVVFASGPVRWLGLVATAVTLLALVLPSRESMPQQRTSP